MVYTPHTESPTEVRRAIQRLGVDSNSLQTQIDTLGIEKVPYVGATADINLGGLYTVTGAINPVNGSDVVTLDFLTEAIAEVVYVADSVTVNTGDSVTGDVADTQVLSDGNVFHVGEVGGVPGFDFQFAFSGVSSFNRIWLHYNYLHTLPAHTIQLRFWNYNTSAFIVVTTFANVYEGGYRFLDLVVDDTNYIDGSGNSIVSLYHISSGNNGHEINVDYVALVKAGFGSANEHGALIGLSDDDHLQYHNDSRAVAWLAAGHETTYNHDNYDAAYDGLFVYDEDLDCLVGTGGVGGGGGSETDPIFVAWQTASDNHANWDTAYGWGDHASGGYLTTATGQRIYTATVETSNATPTAIVGIVIPTGSVTMIVARVVAVYVSDATKGAAYIRTVCYSNPTGSSADGIGSPVSDFTAESTASMDCAFASPGATGDLMVTGVAATSIRWYCEYTLTTVQSGA
jgi:hypothetical protein